MTRDGLRAALSDRLAVAATLFGEVRSEPIEGILAVASVIRTRALMPRWWGAGYKGVCLRAVDVGGKTIGQFSCWWADETDDPGEQANTRAVYDAAEELLGGEPAERTVLSELLWVADGVIGDQIRDHAAKCDHYLTERAYRKAPADHWSRKTPPVLRAGSHVFFRLEA